MGCKCAKVTDEWHGWECSVTGSACMFLYPDSKKCAELYGEGPDAWNEEEGFNQGNDCDLCKYQYMTGRDGTDLGCERADQELSCKFEEEEEE